MILSRLAYRSRQFWAAVLGRHASLPDENLLTYLTPAQLDLFRQMQPAEQQHAYHLMQRLETSGQTNPDLLAAALLHDAGKSLHPLSIFERVVIVLGRYFFRKSAQHWAESTPDGPRRPFVVARRHAGWGADLAAQAGATALTVELIRRHHDPLPPQAGSQTERLLAALQAADNES